MRLLNVTLEAIDLGAMRAFYVDRFGVSALEDSHEVLALRVGWTTLRFVRATSQPAPAHFAFNIPPDAMDAAEAWLRARTAILVEDGAERFDFPSWNAQAVYAMDPAGNVIELIARRRLADRLGERPFGAAALLCVSEIGIVVDDPPQAGRELCETFGLSIFSAADADFTTVGDDEGLLIVVPPGRAWKPTANVMSLPAPGSITIGGGTHAGPCVWEHPPYNVRSAASLTD